MRERLNEALSSFAFCVPSLRACLVIVAGRSHAREEFGQFCCGRGFTFPFCGVPHAARVSPYRNPSTRGPTGPPGGELRRSEEKRDGASADVTIRGKMPSDAFQMVRCLQQKSGSLEAQYSKFQNGKFFKTITYNNSTPEYTKPMSYDASEFTPRGIVTRAGAALVTESHAGRGLLWGHGGASPEASFAMEGHPCPRDISNAYASRPLLIPSLKKNTGSHLLPHD